MKYETMIKESFFVIGKEGSTSDGANFVQKLWKDANGHFDEVKELAILDDRGELCGVWGAMTDFSRSFQPWQEGFSKGLYLAGVEVSRDAQPPVGWVKWQIPGFNYIKVKVSGDSTFPTVIAFFEEKNIPLAGAVQDFTDPATGESYMLFPTERLL